MSLSVSLTVFIVIGLVIVVSCVKKKIDGSIEDSDRSSRLVNPLTFDRLTLLPFIKISQPSDRTLQPLAGKEKNVNS